MTYKAAEGLSLTALAERLGKPVTTVHGWLHGQRRPHADQIADIVAATGGRVTAQALRPDLAGVFVPASDSE